MHRPEARGRAPSLEETFYPFVLRRQDSYTAAAAGPAEGGRPPSPGDRALGVRFDRQASWETERELHLAAELGKALLERNEELGREREREAREWAQRLEAVEQEKHEQRRKFEARESEWEVRLAELEAELAQRSGQWQREHSQEQRTHEETVQDLLTHNQRLVEELSKADTEKDRIRSQLRELKHSLWESSVCQTENQDQLQKLQAQNRKLVERNGQLEQRLRSLSEEKEVLKIGVNTLEDSLIQIQQRSREQEQELAQVQNELDELTAVNKELRQSVREMEQHAELQEFRKLNDSLHSEIQQILNSTQSTLSQGNVAGAMGSGDTFSSLKSHSSLPDNICSGSEGLPSREQVNRQHEASLNENEKIRSLNEQVRLQAIELNTLQEELTTLRKMALIEDGDQLLQQAIASRDRAIGRKNEMELEVERGRIERETLSCQLLHTIKQKIELVQQLEEWQEDMQVVIGQQLRSQHQREGQMASGSNPEKDREASARGFFLRFRKR